MNGLKRHGHLTENQLLRMKSQILEQKSWLLEMKSQIPGIKSWLLRKHMSYVSFQVRYGRITGVEEYRDVF